MTFEPEIVRTIKSLYTKPGGEVEVYLNECNHTVVFSRGSIPNLDDFVRCPRCEAEARRGTAQLSDRGQAGNLFLYAVTLQDHEFGLCVIQRKGYNTPHWYAYMINGVMSGGSYDQANVAVATAVRRIEQSPLAYMDQ